jgi:hypothetical protein
MPSGIAALDQDQKWELQSGGRGAELFEELQVKVI